MSDQPDSTALRVALWRALHVRVDPPPHIIEDEMGLRLAAPDENWRQRPDMDPEALRGVRASIVARARFIEDLAIEESRRGVRQYVILGAGLDTFALRRGDIASRLRVFEVDRAGAQAWKRRRLSELGLPMPDSLRFVPVDFEQESWFEQLTKAGFDATQRAVVSSTGVTLYLTKKAVAATLREIATLARGSTLAMSFVVPLELVEPEDRPLWEMSEKGARRSGTPFISFFAPAEMLALARESGFKDARHVSSADLARRYFSGRSDGLRPSSGEDFLIATT